MLFFDAVSEEASGGWTVLSRSALDEAIAFCVCVDKKSLLLAVLSL